MSDKQVRAQYTREYKLEAVRQVRGGQLIAATAKVLGIPKASLSNWVRRSAKTLIAALLAGGVAYATWLASSPMARWSGRVRLGPKETP